MSITINRQNLLQKCLNEKRVGFKDQKRRHEQWNDNYLLYRLHVEINRLTQRQSVCVPLMKGTIKTLMSKIGEKPEIFFEDKSGDIDREIIINEKWRDDFDTKHMELIDKIDKKQQLIYGISTKKLNWKDGQFEPEVKDVYNVLRDPKTKPYDIESAKFLIETRIYRTVEEVMSNTKYDREGIKDLQSYLSEKNGNETTGEQPKETTGSNLTDKYRDDIQARDERMQALGSENIQDNLAGANTILELNQHFTELWDKDEKRWVRYVCIVADEKVLLSAKPLKKVLGVEFYPFESWSEDLEISDNYPDGVGDILREPNQMINVWYSQYLENRTLRNFGMNFYDSTKDGFEPEEMEPRPGGWYPLPGKPSEVYQRVDIGDLGGVKEDIQFLINIAEKETASTDIEKGAVSDARRTLGEIQIAVSKANERTSSMAPFYNLCWKRFALKWYLLTIANMGEQKVPLYKKNYAGQLVEKEVSKEDIESPKGYKVKVLGNGQKSLEQIDELNKLLAIKKEFPNNAPLNKAIQRRALKVVSLDPEEIEEITSYQAQTQPQPQPQIEPSSNIPQIPNRTTIPGMAV